MHNIEEMKAQQETKFQLRRMLLINAGTNQRRPSGRITSIDPRGGAAVLGANGVGKTTTLRLLPLFFGHLPSKLVSKSEGQEAMLPFILPTDSSAIAYEYQRGGPDDIRLAVLRRSNDDPDVASYWLFPCAFRQDLFVDEQSKQFLTNEQFLNRVIDLGFQRIRLTIAQYRSVILNTQAASKDKALREHRHRFSFGPRSLDNLDRLVAAMLKEQVNFDDITHVALSMVEQRMGRTEHGKLSYRQSKQQITQWIRNRQSFQEALNLANTVEQQRQELDRFHGLETAWRGLWWDVHVLQQHRHDAVAAVQRNMNSLQAQRDQERQLHHASMAALTESHQKAVDVLRQKDSLRNELQDSADHFKAEGASQWAEKLIDLPHLQSEQRLLKAQIDAAGWEVKQAEGHYRNLKTEATTSANAQIQKHQSELMPLGREAEAKRTSIEDQERLALEDQEQEHRSKLEELQVLLGGLQEQQGELRAFVKHPQPSAESLQARVEADQRVRDHNSLVIEAVQAESNANTLHQTARRAFHDQERLVSTARTRLDDANSAVTQAQARLKPAPGTFLDVLRQESGRAWAKDLARVIDPALLSRDDLGAQLMEEGADLLYGWSLNTDLLAEPAWVDDAQAKAALQEAQEHAERLTTAMEVAQKSLAEKSAQLLQAEQHLAKSRAEANRARTHLQTSKTALEKAELQLAREQATAKAHIEGKLREVGQELSNVQQQISNLTSEDKKAREALRGAFSERKKQVSDRLAADQARIQQAVQRIEEGLVAHLRELDLQLKHHLEERGVDSSLREEQNLKEATLCQQIETLEEKKPLVNRWRQFLKDDGPHHLVLAIEDSRVQKAYAEQIEVQRRELDRAFREEDEVFEKSKRDFRSQKNQLEEDVQHLTRLHERFQIRPAFMLSQISPDASVKTLDGQIKDKVRDLDESRQNLRKRNTTISKVLRNGGDHLAKLAEHFQSQVRESDEPDQAQAQAWCQCFNRIGPEIISVHNQELKTIFSHVAALSSDIRKFETEVKLINKQLQEGLSGVKCFERIQDLKLDIVADFEGLGFYKRLTTMERVIRDYQLDVSGQSDTQLASVAVVAPLAEFASAIGTDGSIEINYAQHITVSGSVRDNGTPKAFKRASELSHISSNGLTSLILITLMTALINTMRAQDPVFVPWVTDEIATLDPSNFRALMQMLRDNRIDVVTASPEIGPLQHALFAQRYLFQDGGRIQVYQAPNSPMGQLMQGVRA